VTIVYISIAINILVAGFWGIVLAFFPGRRFRVWPYGEDSPGTRILSSLYLAIAAFSVYALTKPVQLRQLCLFLFAFQIVYKVLSAVTVRSMKNPVVLSNLLIVVPHSFSVHWLLNSISTVR